MTTTVRQIHAQVSNVLDYLAGAELASYINPVSLTDRSVSFHWHAPKGTRFLEHRAHPTVEQYLLWVDQGAYSAILFEGSLLQLDYTVDAGKVVGHRLAYVPCPYGIDVDLLRGGDPLLDIMELYAAETPLLRSPVRLDFDPEAAKPGHPATHLTINGSDCRIACIAPMHVLRFVSFIFEQFYPRYWDAHRRFFEPGRRQHVGQATLTDDDRHGMHIAWSMHTGGAVAPGGASPDLGIA